MDSTRQLRVSRLMQKELGNLFSNELKEYTAHSLVTVTETRVTPDLSVCKVFVSIFPPDKRKPVFELIHNHNKEIRHALPEKWEKKSGSFPN